MNDIKNGFLLIDKEVGINSFKLVIAMRKIAGQRRVGYAGTLDPLASGLMILALGEYTKLLPHLEVQDKVYEAEILLGKTSDTFDTDGTVTDRKVETEPDRATIEHILREKFTGRLEQRPPRFSAISIGGRRAYDMARGGEEFELQLRPVEIFSNEILFYDYPLLRMRVHCASGTYIRSLAHDLGEVLGCGGVVSALRRTAVGRLRVEQAVTMKQILPDTLLQSFISPELVLADKKCVHLNDTDYAVLARGNFIDNPLNDFATGQPITLAATEKAMALWQGRVAGILETTLAGSKLKFQRKLHIF